MNSGNERDLTRIVEAGASRWYRAFLGILGLGSILGGILAWLCIRTLSSDEEAVAITRQFGSLQAVLTWSVLFTFALLLAVQTQAFIRRGASGRIYIYGWLYLLIFTGVDYVWLSEAVFQHTKATNTWEGGFNAMAFVGLAQVTLGGLVSLVLFLVARGRRQP